MSKIIKFESSYIEPYPLEVSGESFHRDEIEAIFSYFDEDEGIDDDSQIATLILENENLHDPNAVRVEIDKHHVGYLSKPAAKIYRQKIKELGFPDAIGICTASVRGGFRKRSTGELVDFGVRLDLDLNNMVIAPEHRAQPKPEVPAHRPLVSKSPPIQIKAAPTPSQKITSFIDWAFAKTRWWKISLILLIGFLTICCIGFMILGTTQ